MNIPCNIIFVNNYAFPNKLNKTFADAYDSLWMGKGKHMAVEGPRRGDHFSYLMNLR